MIVLYQKSNHSFRRKKSNTILSVFPSNHKVFFDRLSIHVVDPFPRIRESTQSDREICISKTKEIKQRDDNKRDAGDINLLENRKLTWYGCQIDNSRNDGAQADEDRESEHR